MPEASQKITSRPPNHRQKADGKRAKYIARVRYVQIEPSWARKASDLPSGVTGFLETQKRVHGRVNDSLDPRDHHCTVLTALKLY